MANELTDSQVLSCRRAAARFYRAGGGYRIDEYLDVVHNAYVIGMCIARKQPTLVGKCFHDCVYFRLIDKHRSETGSRYLRKHGLAPLTYIQYDEQETRDEDYCTSPVTRRIVNDWVEHNSEKFYRVKCETESGKSTITVPESLLQTAIERTLRGTPDWQKKCVLGYYYDGKTMREIGADIGRTESRISQVLSQFKNRLKSAIIHYCGE